MHDLRAIRDDPRAFDAALARRGAEPAAARILDLDEARRQAATLLQEAQARRNEASKAIGLAMREGDAAKAEAIKQEVARIKDAMPALEADERELGDRLDGELAALPNLPDDDVPDGADEAGNVEQTRWGEPPSFAFAAKEHADLGPPMGLDFETAAAMSGARFAFLRGGMARLHRALGQFMLDFQTSERGFAECAPPLLVRDEAVFGTGQLPKFADDLFSTSKEADQLSWVRDELDNLASVHSGKGLNEQTNRYLDAIDDVLNRISDQGSSQAHADRRWLIPTAEVSLTNSVREQILDDLARPVRLTALTPCFRSEAGAAGKDTRGFIRQHQFEKVELVTICTPEQAAAEHQHMLESAQAILERLGLPHRTMLLCAGDMGASARRTFDLEVWLAGQQAYREISSISWCGDWQARRMNARYRPQGGKSPAFVHTLNGSGLAVGRTLVAVLENYQQADGSVLVPSVLAPYMGGIDRLEPLA